MSLTVTAYDITVYVTYSTFSGHSVVRFHANTEVKDGKLKLNDIKINLDLGDVEVHIIKSQNPALGESAIWLLMITSPLFHVCRYRTYTVCPQNQGTLCNSVTCIVIIYHSAKLLCTQYIFLNIICLRDMTLDRINVFCVLRFRGQTRYIIQSRTDDVGTYYNIIIYYWFNIYFIHIIIIISSTCCCFPIDGQCPS